MVHGDSTRAPVRETAGMCVRRLSAILLSSDLCLVVLDTDDAGQGAHREVGSEGFEAKHRAVAEQGEPVGQSPGDTEPALWPKEVLGVPGRIKVCADGTVRKGHALPREVSYGPVLVGVGYLGV